MFLQIITPALLLLKKQIFRINVILVLLLILFTNKNLLTFRKRVYRCRGESGFLLMFFYLKKIIIISNIYPGALHNKDKLDSLKFLKPQDDSG